MDAAQVNRLVAACLAARRFSYAPYSKFGVGAAVLCADDSLYTGNTGQASVLIGGQGSSTSAPNVRGPHRRTVRMRPPDTGGKRPRSPIGRIAFTPGSVAVTFISPIEAGRGCNVENCSYGLTVCAERTAILKAVSEGHRSFKALAVCSDSEQVCLPCGSCRQFMAEFGDFDIYAVNDTGEKSELHTVHSLLPHAFTPADLKAAGT